MVEPTRIPAFGFARGAVVRAEPDGPNMLVVRCLADRTVVIVIEADIGGQVRLRDLKTIDLLEVLPAQTPSPHQNDLPELANPNFNRGQP